ncbi:hypothetical protein AUR64_03930 [Haloprofundus marisrubri]|uniref:Uncharacterized protein n=1 Tax=Haloprofundus marisrubri TaxID=1514971 RepID=A0A0W1RCI1_9EURY|nr:hypothetical protein [Haloprofundus marisrubri]KTG11413.1 hypothetical protein AUR64_03930 [Haloprofundus marisrubri]
MNQNTAKQGVEVWNREYGRGVILKTHAETDSEMASALIYFYHPDITQDVPLASLETASEMLSTDIKRGSCGFEVEIHDGMFTFYIEPDGNGTGYEVSLTAGNATLEQTHFSTEEIVPTFEGP